MYIYIDECVYMYTYANTMFTTQAPQNEHFVSDLYLIY